MRRLLIVLCLVVLSKCDDNEWRQVRTAQGHVRGRRDPEGGLYAFYNIPYAIAPRGRERFKAPYPPPVWLQPLDAVDKGIICMQSPSPFIDTKSKTMQEDCLIANVYVPDTEDKNLPVIVYVHGGAFELGYGDMIKPTKLVKTKKVIVVNFNYRLGVHGFLCLGSNTAPGNAGLKDQVALLRWVKKNIANFGGNPNDVTIAGYSAGSVSADLLMLSKSAEGLFNKVILESGASVGSIAIQMDPLETAKTYAKLLNFSDFEDFHALEEFYATAPLDSILLSTFLQRKDSTVFFSPCIERKGKGAFLEDSPVNIIKNRKYKKVPILIGTSNLEGSLHIPIFAKWKDGLNQKFSDFLPTDLQFENDAERDEIGKKVKEFYFDDQPIAEETILKSLEYFGDLTFGYPTLKHVKLHVEAGHDQIYLYEYSFVDDSTPYVPFTEVRGAGHCAQTTAVLDGGGPMVPDESNISEQYKQIKASIREMWLNFATKGKPVPEESNLPAWPVANENGTPYMSIGDVIELDDGVYLGKRGQFWEDIYQKYYKAPVPPPQPPPEKHTEL
ncbi:para-nitrobenzyl esterase [Helicoverpa armigera]|uniref:para-nitrobenzyl esterase n=1 Tax=Helicoverpa armigera TaxID=29058 RepID=UPI0030827F21